MPSMEQDYLEALLVSIQQKFFEVFCVSVNFYAFSANGCFLPIFKHTHSLGINSFCAYVRKNIRNDAMALCAYCTSDDLRSAFQRSRQPCWVECHLGLRYICLPLGACSSSVDSVPQVALTVGNFRTDSSPSSDDIFGLIQDSLQRYSARGFSASQSSLPIHEEALRNAFDKIPYASASQLDAVFRSVVTWAPLLDVIYKSFLDRREIAEAEKLSNELGLDSHSINISRQQLWEKIDISLQQVVRHFSLPGACLYVCSEEDYSIMSRVVTVGLDGVELAKELVLSSYDEFSLVREMAPLVLPNDDHFLWLDAKWFFGSDSVLLFGMETSTGHTALLGICTKVPTAFNYSRNRVLIDAITKRIFPYIESALFGIELDYLMSETGHLLGRAHGKIVKGIKLLTSELPRIGASSSETLERAHWMVLDGTVKLDTIRNNLYSFAPVRGGAAYRGDGLVDRLRAVGMNGIEETNPPLLVDLALFVEEQRVGFTKSLEGMERQVHWNVCPPPVVARIDDITLDRLMLVLVNLFDNARKFSYKDTDIYIDTEHRLGRFVFSITSTGVGVAGDERERMFKRFAKSRFRDKMKRVEGLGLGLAFCRKVIKEELCGDISLESAPSSASVRERFPGDGWKTTVSFWVPCEE